MKATNIPKNLPMFPGHSFADPFKTKFNKQHVFDVKSGAQTGKKF